MVGYSAPCPCCSKSRRSPLERSESLPVPGLPTPHPAKIARSASDPSPSSDSAAALLVSMVEATKAEQAVETAAAVREPEKNASLEAEKQEPEAKLSAEKAGGKKELDEKPEAKPKPKPKTAAEVKVAERMKVTVSFRCGCGICQEVVLS